MRRSSMGMLACCNVRLQCWHGLAELLTPVAVQWSSQQSLGLRLIDVDPPPFLQLLQHSPQGQEEGAGKGQPVLLVLQLWRVKVLSQGSGEPVKGSA